MNQEKIKQFHQIRISGKLYDPDFLSYQQSLVQKMNMYNVTGENEEDYAIRATILKECAGTYGENLFIMLPALYKLWLIAMHFGNNVFINFDAHFVDDNFLRP